MEISPDTTLLPSWDDPFSHLKLFWYSHLSYLHRYFTHTMHAKWTWLVLIFLYFARNVLHSPRLIFKFDFDLKLWMRVIPPGTSIPVMLLVLTFLKWFFCHCVVTTISSVKELCFFYKTNYLFENEIFIFTRTASIYRHIAVEWVN